MKILIFGASGTGTTTVGKSIAKKLEWTFLDADDYYWEKTNPPFQKKIELEKRNENLKKDFLENENVILSGSLYSWSKFWNSAFDFGFFLRIPHKIRMNRLLNREIEIYGDELKTNHKIKEKSKAFLEWAAKYDDKNFTGRSLSRHEEWIEAMKYAVFKIDGDLTNNERQIIITKKIEDYRQ